MSQPLQPAANRNHGIDLLRIVAMVYVIILHTLGKGGVLNAAVPGSAQYTVAWFMEIAAYCAVDLFALISGYVSYTDTEKKPNYSSYLVLWLQVVCWGVVVTLVYNWIDPALVTKGDLLDMLHPVTSKLYWYFTAYTGMFVLSPLLNGAVRGCSKSTLKRTFILMLLTFSACIVEFDLFNLSTGYSTIWLVILYLMGAIVKKCDIGANIRPVAAFIGILGLTVFSWLWLLFSPVEKRAFVSYTSPTILGSALLYLIAVPKLNFSARSGKVISFLSQGAFAAYLLNNQRFIWNNFMPGRFAALAQSSIPVLVTSVLLFSLLFVLIAILLDQIRSFFFRLFRIKKLVNSVVSLCSIPFKHLKA